MNLAIQKIEQPELVFGFVAPIGIDLRPAISALTDELQASGYRIIEIKVTDPFPKIEKYIPATPALDGTTQERRFDTYIAYGNKLREVFGDNAILAAASVVRIVKSREREIDPSAPSSFEKTAFILHQFKRKEEIDLLRSVYGELFFQISVYSRRGARVDYLSRRFAGSDNSAHAQKYRAASEKIIHRDEDEVEEEHGQRVAKIFHDADFIVNTDEREPDTKKQIGRFVELLFSSNRHSPTKMEYGMFVAKAAALRTLDLSRQVGAAVFSEAGEIVALGSNEVPKAGGGTYWADDKFDDREYLRGIDSNDRRKKQILAEVLEILGHDLEALKTPKLAESQFMDALEYGRVIHAEMSAICDAARLGHQIKDSILYTTTFPCHMCAKHIVASGLKQVVFLEPYPKSLASELHSDAIEIEGSDRGKFESFPSVQFKHFHGVCPRRFRELFERSKRKDKEGNFVPYIEDLRRPLIDIKLPTYGLLENLVIRSMQIALAKLNVDESVFSDGDEAPKPEKPKKRTAAKVSNQKSRKSRDLFGGSA